MPGLNDFQIIMTAADAAKWPMNSWIDTVKGEVDQGCTVVYDGVPYYDVAVRLKGSAVGRIDAGARGFHITFHGDDLFRGVLQDIGLDRSGRHYGGTYGQDEIVAWELLNAMGNIPSMYDDLVDVEAPTVVPGLALLQLDKYDDDYEKSQYPNGAGGPDFKYELVYYGTSGAADGAWLSQNLGTDKEQYRYIYEIDNDVTSDDYAG